MLPEGSQPRESTEVGAIPKGRTRLQMERRTDRCSGPWDPDASSTWGVHLMSEQRRSVNDELRYLGRAASILATHPREGLERLRGRMAILVDDSLRRASRAAKYEPVSDWLPRLHRAVYVEWPCAVVREFEEAWTEMVASLSARGLPGGRGHDADRALAQAIWCVTRHLGPERVVETGVARGVTSAFVLLALERNESGHLWSIDLPPVMPVWHSQSAVAVPESLKRRWTYVRGSSRRRLPQLLDRLGAIDLFVHDSLHTEENMRFEMKAAWSKIRPGGVLVADDVDSNRGFGAFGSSVAGAESMVVRHSEKGGLFGVIVKAVE